MILSKRRRLINVQLTTADVIQTLDVEQCVEIESMTIWNTTEPMAPAYKLLQAVWSDVGIKEAKFYKSCSKGSQSSFFLKAVFLRIPPRVTKYLGYFFRILKIAQSGHTGYKYNLVMWNLNTYYCVLVVISKISRWLWKVAWPHTILICQWLPISKQLKKILPLHDKLEFDDRFCMLLFQWDTN